MKPARPCIVTTDEMFPDMVVMAIDNRLAAFLLAVCGECAHSAEFTSALYDNLRNLPDVDEIFKHLMEKDLSVDVGSAFVLANLYKDTKWEVVK